MIFANQHKISLNRVSAALDSCSLLGNNHTCSGATSISVYPHSTDVLSPLRPVVASAAAGFVVSGSSRRPTDAGRVNKEPVNASVGHRPPAVAKCGSVGGFMVRNQPLSRPVHRPWHATTRRADRSQATGRRHRMNAGLSIPNRPPLCPTARLALSCRAYEHSR